MPARTSKCPRGCFQISTSSERLWPPPVEHGGYAFGAHFELGDNRQRLLVSDDTCVGMHCAPERILELGAPDLRIREKRADRAIDMPAEHFAELLACHEQPCALPIAVSSVQPLCLPFMSFESSLSFASPGTSVPGDDNVHFAIRRLGVNHLPVERHA